MQEEIDIEVEKGTNEYLTIYLDEELTYRQVQRAVRTKDRWIRLQRRRFRGTTNCVDVQIISRGLWGGYHRGKIIVDTENEYSEYIINLTVNPKRKSSIWA